MKKIGLFLLVALFSLNFAIFGQNPNREKRPGRNDAPRERTFTPQQRADRLAKELNLTEEQKAKVAEFYAKRDAENAKRRAEVQKERDKKREAARTDREKFRAEAEKNRKAHDAELEKIIGKEKMDELNKVRAERQQQWKENRGKRGGMNRKNARK